MLNISNTAIPLALKKILTKITDLCGIYLTFPVPTDTYPGMGGLLSITIPFEEDRLHNPAILQPSTVEKYIFPASKAILHSQSV